MRDPAHHEDDVDRPVSHNLIGDVHVGALGVTDLGRPANDLYPRPAVRSWGRDGGRRDRFGTGNGDSIDVEHPDLVGKPIPAAGNRLDVLTAVRTLAERLAHERDVYCKVRFLDEGIGPDRFEKHVLLENPAGVANEERERVERLWRQGHVLAIARENTFLRVEAKRSEVVVARSRIHR